MCAASITLPSASRTSPARARSTRACSACGWRRARTWASPAPGTTWAARSSISSSSGRCSRTSTRPIRTSRSGWRASSWCGRPSTRAASPTSTSAAPSSGSAIPTATWSSSASRGQPPSEQPMGGLREDFAALAAAGERTDLARAALVIARIAYPDLDPAPYLRQLDDLAAAVRPRLYPQASPEAAVTELAGYLFGECGFRGNQEEYYDPRNSYLNDVLERRTGIPITLSVVLLEVGRRVGLPLEGVGFPGHFLVRVAGSRGPLLLDPFYGGRPIGERELLARYRTFVGSDAPALPPDALATTGTPAILTRMLRNLLRAYLDQKDHAHALAAADLLLVLVPDSADEVRVRGLLYEHLECFGAALGDFRRYLELAPEAPDAERIRERVARLVRIAIAIH